MSLIRMRLVKNKKELIHTSVQYLNGIIKNLTLKYSSHTSLLAVNFLVTGSHPNPELQRISST
ncbi:hypothetical protein Syun_003345 [Stephania yunnanensis]|uniref:Uncharacterized protein n=1 Tax=Stephania yunnanensis TaxID=152371 RepID=A0AAP0Q049_9MAGN